MRRMNREGEGNTTQEPFEMGLILGEGTGKKDFLVS